MGLFDNLFGSSGAKSAMNNNVALANQYASDVSALGQNNNAQMGSLASMVLSGLNQSKQDASATIDNINKSYDTASDKQNAQLAAMGYTPSSNSVYASNNAQLEQKRANSIAQAQNQANQQNFNNTLSGVASAGNLYNTGFNNQYNTMSAANQSQMGANNALGAYYQNKYNQGMGLLGAGLGLAGAAINPVGAAAGVASNAVK